MKEEREEAGGGPHFSPWHLEPSGGQRAAPAGAGAAGSFPTPAAGVEPRAGPALRTRTRLQAGGVSSLERSREAPRVPPSWGHAFRTATHPPGAPSRGLWPTEAAGCGRQRKRGLGPHSRWGFQRAPGEGAHRAPPGPLGAFPPATQQGRRGRREAEPVRYWPGGPRPQLGRAPPPWVCGRGEAAPRSTAVESRPVPLLLYELRSARHTRRLFCCF